MVIRLHHFLDIIWLLDHGSLIGFLWAKHSTLLIPYYLPGVTASLLTHSPDRDVSVTATETQGIAFILDVWQKTVLYLKIA